MEAFIIVMWLICGVLGYRIGKPKGQGGLGVALGLLFGVLGLIVIAVVRPARSTEHTQLPPQPPV